MTENERLGTHYHLNEGWLCLDFANTANWHASSVPVEELTSYPVLLEWARGEGIVSPEEAEGLLAEASRNPQAAEAALERAIALREAIYRIFSALAHDRPAPPEDLAFLNGVLAEKLDGLWVVGGASGFGWGWRADPRSLDWFLGPIARSAAELLTSPALARVGQCADDRGCGWLFLDLTKNHSRRWCSMESCGNRAKVMQHYQRKHQHAS
jgi:predicted RNA-binding Zn ribbon-like protein